MAHAGTIQLMVLTRNMLAGCITFLCIACGSSQDQTRSDAQQALSNINESALLASEGERGHLPATYQSAQAGELADQAEQTAKTLEHDSGNDSDRKRLAEDSTRAAAMLRATEDRRPAARAFEDLAADARDAAKQMRAT